MRDHASFAGEVNLGAATVNSNVELSTASFSKTLIIYTANIHGSLFMDGASIAGDVDAHNIDVHGNLLMSNHASFAGEVNLASAKVGVSLDMSTASFSKALNANSLNVNGALLMNHASFAGDVNLVASTVGSGLYMSSASFSKTVDAYGVNVHGDAIMDGNATFADAVKFGDATVGSILNMGTASFSKTFNADGLNAHGGLFMKGASFAGDVSLINAKVGWLDLRSATAGSIDLSDLSGATGSELQLMGLHWQCGKASTEAEKSGKSKTNASNKPRNWPLGDPSWRTDRCDGTEASLPKLILRNTHIEALQDDQDSWPPVLDLEGLHFDRLGGLGGMGRADMRRRSAEQWIDWLEHFQGC
jgi:hypothetical protein